MFIASPNNNLSRLSVFALIAMFVLLFSILRFADVQSRAMLEHDEGITLLGVTGHQGSFMQLDTLDLLDKWQPTSVWQSFVSLSGPVSLKQVQHDLNQFDIHPPLYFWSLSAFLQGYGSFDKVAYLLNWAFAVVAILLFYPLLRLRYDRRTAAMLLAAFSFTPALAGPFAVLRQYELMLLAGTGCLFAMSCYLHANALQRLKRRAMLVCFTLFAYVGLMAHAQFLLVLAGIMGAVLMLSIGALRKITVFCCLASAALLFFLSNSGFLQSVARLQRQSQDASLLEFVMRLRTMVNAMDELVGLYPIPAFLVFTGLLGWAVWRCWQMIKQQPGTECEDTLQTFWLWSSVLIIGLVFLQYLSMNSPRHAIGGRYFLAILPCFILLTALWLQQKKRLRQSWLIALLLFGTSVNLLLEATMSRAEKEQRIAKALSQASLVLINNPTRGVLSPLLPSLPSAGQVLVMNHLIADDELLALAGKLKLNDIIWLQAGHQVSAERTAAQKDLLMQKLLLDEIGENSGVFKVVRQM